MMAEQSYRGLELISQGPKTEKRKTPRQIEWENKLQSLCLVRQLDRLSTFSGWGSSRLQPHILADMGFYFLGQNDFVKCFFCEKVHKFWHLDEPLANFLDYSVALFRHVQFMDLMSEVLHHSCTSVRFLMNVPVPLWDETEIERVLKYQCSLPEVPEFQIEDKRLRSYDQYAGILNVSPDILAQAGLYYFATKNRIFGTDRVRCFHCGGIFQNWELNDNPWIKHAYYYPTCSFLLKQKGQAYVYRHLSQNASLPRPIIPKQHWNEVPCLGGDCMPDPGEESIGTSRMRTVARLLPSRRIFQRMPAGEWNLEDGSTAHAICLDDKDRAKYLYNNGGLRNWSSDEPNLFPNGPSIPSFRSEKQPGVNQLGNHNEMTTGTDFDNVFPVGDQRNFRARILDTLGSVAFERLDCDPHEGQRTSMAGSYHTGPHKRVQSSDCKNENENSAFGDNSLDHDWHRTGLHLLNRMNQCSIRYVEEEPRVVDGFDSRSYCFLDKFADASTRQKTFGILPEQHVLRSPAFFMAGFYYLGFDDKVQCVFCRREVENWSSSDNPCDKKWHKSDCDMLARLDEVDRMLNTRPARTVNGNALHCEQDSSIFKQETVPKIVFSTDDPMQNQLHGVSNRNGLHKTRRETRCSEEVQAQTRENGTLIDSYPENGTLRGAAARYQYSSLRIQADNNTETMGSTQTKINLSRQIQCPGRNKYLMADEMVSRSESNRRQTNATQKLPSMGLSDHTQHPSGFHPSNTDQIVLSLSTRNGRSTGNSRTGLSTQPFSRSLKSSARSCSWEADENNGNPESIDSNRTSTSTSLSEPTQHPERFDHLDTDEIVSSLIRNRTGRLMENTQPEISTPTNHDFTTGYSEHSFQSSHSSGSNGARSGNAQTEVSTQTNPEISGSSARSTRSPFGEADRSNSASGGNARSETEAGQDSSRSSSRSVWSIHGGAHGNVVESGALSEVNAEYVFSNCRNCVIKLNNNGKGDEMTNKIEIIKTFLVLLVFVMIAFALGVTLDKNILKDE